MEHKTNYVSKFGNITPFTLPSERHTKDIKRVFNSSTQAPFIYSSIHIIISSTNNKYLPLSFFSSHLKWGKIGRKCRLRRFGGKHVSDTQRC